VLQFEAITWSDHDFDNGTVKSLNPPIVVIRIDDVQDYAFRDAQLFLLRYHLENKMPTSLAVIPDLLESDSELLTQISESLRIGSEVSAHGWSHEDLSKLSMIEQEWALGEAKSALMQLFGANTTVLVPPMFGYNNETLMAMRNTGFEVLSSAIDLQAPMRRPDGIVTLPATVEYSDFVDGKWVSKSVQGLMREVDLSVERYGYAVLVIHPQELMRGSL
jgi:peptidoglycan/xylan/chitin deacetylase (PgdA/CDA1 family)